jgi:hypothetical protein
MSASIIDVRNAMVAAINGTMAAKTQTGSAISITLSPITQAQSFYDSPDTPADLAALPGGGRIVVFPAKKSGEPFTRGGVHSRTHHLRMVVQATVSAPTPAICDPYVREMETICDALEGSNINAAGIPATCIQIDYAVMFDPRDLGGFRVLTIAAELQWMTNG